MAVPKFLLLLLVLSIPLIAQDLIPEAPAAPADAAEPVYVPLTLSQSYQWSLGQIFAPQHIAAVAARTALLQPAKHSDGWGSDVPSYGVRMASWLGTNLVRENLAFGVRAIDGEDPRYVRCGRGSVMKRARYAVTHTVTVRGRDGSQMPAWSLLADYGTPFVTQEWRHGGMQGRRELREGTMVLGGAVASNLYKEFWPDLKRKLRH